MNPTSATPNNRISINATLPVKMSERALLWYQVSDAIPTKLEPMVVQGSANDLLDLLWPYKVGKVLLSIWVMLRDCSLPALNGFVHGPRSL